MTPFFTIGITSFNYLKYLRQCIDSVLDQSFQDFEIILYDDASTDGSQQFLTQFREEKKITEIVLGKENVGVSSARNFVFSKASGRYFMYLDADDYLLPGFLEKMYQWVVSNPTRHLFQYGEYWLDDKTGKISLSTEIPKIETQWDLMYPVAVGGGFVFSRYAFEISRGFAISLRVGWEDWDFWIRNVRQFGSVPTDVVELAYRINKPSREKEVELDWNKIYDLCRKMFLRHSELCLCGIRVPMYRTIIYPEDVIGVKNPEIPRTKKLHDIPRRRRNSFSRFRRV